MVFKTGDLYIWDNFRLLHRQERVLRGAEDVTDRLSRSRFVQDRYRILLVGALKGYVDEAWLVHMPIMQLKEMLKLVKQR